MLSVDEMGRIAPPSFTSVGRNGTNAPGDVFVIQSLLNDRLPKPRRFRSAWPVSTPSGDRNLPGRDPADDAASGRIDPGSATYYALAARRWSRAYAAVGSPFGRSFRGGRCRRRLAQEVDHAHSITVFNGRWRAPGALHAARQQQPFGIKAVGDHAVEVRPRVIKGESITVTAAPDVRFAVTGVR